MSNISTPDIVATRFVGALYGESLSYQQQQYVLTNSANLTNIMNALYTSDFGTQTNAQVAATVVSNLGITGVAATIATNVITADLNAAVAGQQGATIAGILNGFATMTGNAVFGSFATAWETKVGAADAASSVVGAGNQQLGNISTKLTVGSNAAGTFVPTFTTGTTVPVGALTLNDGGSQAVVLSMPAGATVAASLLTVNGAGTDNITADISGSAWATVANATINGGGVNQVTASSAQNVTVNQTAQLANTSFVYGGNNVNFNTSGITTGSINIGNNTTATNPTGAVTVNATYKDAAAGGGTFTVYGGTTVTVNQSVTYTTSAGAVAQAAVTVNGTKSTTAVTVI